ncbi:MAG: transposase [Alphaproteobacteria bacterium]|nr:transposase [Alphaproteobacteria bacterium]MBV9370969.1 transposase [Alphaproteobacteria bacterium]MBV9899512.1 transposase [Alphaproteobacteria bacterium]
MPRSARLVLPDIPHHVTQRGTRRQPTFFGDGDYRLYLALLRAWCGKSGTAVWSWCLMPNHVHLILVPSAQDGLRAAVAETHRRYAWLINRREGWQGHLWQDRFASFPMDDRHLVACARYVELNPVRAGLVPRAQDWPWSSARAHLGLGADGLTDAGALPGRIGPWGDFLAAGQGEEERERIRAHVRSGRPLGDDAFVARLEAAAGRPLRPKPRGRAFKRGQ